MTAHSLKVVDPSQSRKSLRVGRIQLQEPVPLPDAWGEVFGDPVVASAILDRLMHRAVVFNIKGPSWRMREHQALAEAVKA